MPKRVKAAIASKRFGERSIALFPDFVFGTTGEQAIVCVEFPNTPKEGSDMEKQFTQEDLDRAKAQAVEDAVKAKDKEFTDKSTALEADLEKAQKALKAQREKEREDKIAQFTEKYTAKGVAPVILDGAKDVLTNLDSETVLQFSDKTESAMLDRALAFVESVFAAAEASMTGEGEKRLFVPQGTVAEGKQFTSPGQGSEADDAKVSEELAAFVNPPKKS